MKHISSYSGGGASWYTSEILAERYGKDNVINLFADTLIEDEDTYRFIDETTEKSGIELVRVADGRDPWEVFHDVKWIGNSQVAQCSSLLKQKMCRAWVEDNFEVDECIIYVGIDWTESHRMKDIQEGWKPYRAEALLTEPPYIDKEFIFSKMAEQGIKKPRLYEMGFSHNNCGGFCVRAGKGHFINLLQKMPERYKYHEAKEQEMREYLDRDDVSILSNTVFSHYELRDSKETEDENQVKLFDEMGNEQPKNKVAVYVKQPYTLRQLREDWENGLGSQVDLDDIGGCGCFTTNYKELVSI
jgi:hypothetical protein